MGMGRGWRGWGGDCGCEYLRMLYVAAAGWLAVYLWYIWDCAGWRRAKIEG